ncbi:MAG: phenylalanine--tRNA ligase subunit beta [Thiotrichaceae bacterium]|nr:phenylalanine--tRNA ligase subunit beta [Thiotrichaceae bacterium]
MKFSEQWLRTWVNPAITTEELVKYLTMAGLEIDSVEAVAPAFHGVVVAEVLSVAPHPDAEKLQVCQVNVGKEAPLNIVCGARNVVAGMRVPAAVIGAVLPNDFKIKAAKLRGVPSEGMLCSAKEIGLAEASEGLMPLPSDAPVGMNIREYLQLDDVSLEVDLTPNRGDCLSVAGVARELGLLTRHNLTPVACTPVAAKTPETFPVNIQAEEACPHYVGRVIRNINLAATTPFWMQERLRRSGLRSISPVVDVTNYVLLELGQPMHAFDLDKLSGSIQVRLATAGESLKLLDGQTVTLDAQSLVIADEKQAHALAGVMGGADSAVSAETQNIFLESAFFTPRLLAGCARRYGLHTDSSHRFERGVDPQLQRHAIERATALLLEIVGGEVGEVVEVSSAQHLPTPPQITLRASRIQRLLGTSFPKETVTDILTRLGMQVSVLEDAWQVHAPSFRFDINIEADLIEELARVNGYDNLPRCKPVAGLQLSATNHITDNLFQTALVQRGYQEVITYSFVDVDLQKLLDPEGVSIALANPIAKRQDNPMATDMSVMRTTLWTGLLQALMYNQQRQQSRIRFFETGLRFVQVEGALQQEKMLSGILTGSRVPEQWSGSAENVDFFDLKGDVEAILNLGGEAALYQFKAAQHPALHPGQTANIYKGDEWVGILGALHPSIAQKLDFSTPVYLFELRVAPLSAIHAVQFKEVSKYPSVRRDLAMLVDEQVLVGDLLSEIRKLGTELLTDLHLFDVYQGDGIESGKKSLAMGLIFQAFSRNLVESEVDTVIGQLLVHLEKHFGAQLRK